MFYALCLQRASTTATTSTTFDGSALLKQSNKRSLSSYSAVESSAELLARMRSQNALVSSSSETDTVNAGDVSANTDPQIAELLRDIRDFVACGCSIDGQATTKEILDHFRTRIQSELTAKFKALLKQVCTLQKVDGVGIWKLKHDFH